MRRALVPFTLLALFCPVAAFGAAELDCTEMPTIQKLQLDKRLPHKFLLNQKVSFTIQGRYTNPDWTLLIEVEGAEKVTRGVEIQEDSTFKIEIHLAEDAENLGFVGIGPAGEVERQNCKISREGGTGQSLGGSNPQEQPTRWDLGLSQTFSTFTETARPSVSQFSLTGKAGYRYPIQGTNWGISASAFATLLPIFHSPSELASARFLGINLRSTYRLSERTKWTPGGFSLATSAGWYYWSMIVSDQSYGLKYVFGPQVFVSGSRPTQYGKVQIYTKFAPLSTGGVPSLGNAEIAIGAAHTVPELWGWTFLPKKTWITLDISTLSVDTTIPKRSVSLSTLSLGLSVEL